MRSPQQCASTSALEREITNYWIAKYFEQELAREPRASTWAALLLGWIRQVRLVCLGMHSATWLAPMLRTASVCVHCSCTAAR